MGPRNSLFKRAIAPLLAVATTSALCAPVRAATATYDVCKADPNSSTGIIQRVECSMTDTGSGTTWSGATFNCQVLGGGDSQTIGRIDISGEHFLSPGDYYFPSKSEGAWITFYVNYHGTYNNWCICDGGNSGGPFYASTGGSTYVQM